MLTDQQTRVITQCKKLGYGYAKFAASVESQGRCTDKQFTTMTAMLSAVEYRRNNPPHKVGRQIQLDAAFADYAEGGDF